MVADRSLAARGVVRQIRSPRALFCKVDVTVPRQVQKLVDTAVAEFGTVDVLLSNAGILGRPYPVDVLPLDAWDRTLAVNLTGCFLCCKYVLPVMKRKRSGSIIMTSSTAGLVGAADFAAYCASKGGVVQLTRALALEAAEFGIRVNCICPGWTETPMIKRMLSTKRDRHEAVESTPLGRIGDPREVARAAMFLASEESSYVTGAILPVDGGFLAR